VGRNVRDDLAHMSWERQVFAIPNEGHHNCAHFVLNSTSLQLIPAYSTQSSGFAQTLAGVGLSEPT
jgi:hypothetical protein